jgi:hypothetical protein
VALRPWGIRNGGIEELMRKGEDPFEKSFLRPIIKHPLLKEKIA